MAFGTTITAVPGVWQTYNSDAKTVSINAGNGVYTVGDGAHGADHFYVECDDWVDGNILELREKRSVPDTAGTGAKIFVFGFNKDKSESWICPAAALYSDEDHTFGVSVFGLDATQGFSDVYQVNTDRAYSILVVISVAAAPVAGTALIQGRFIKQLRT